MMKPAKGALIGLIAGLILTVVIVLYMFTAAVSFILPYIVGFSLIGMVIYGVIREQVFSCPKKENQTEQMKSKYDKYFPD